MSWLDHYSTNLSAVISKARWSALCYKFNESVSQHNADAVILAHNHPSGVPEPSRADISLTRRLTDALTLIDVRVLDHIVVGGAETVSFAERGLI